MKVLVTGANGFLGRYLVDELAKTGCEFIGLNRELCDLTNRRAVKDVIESYDPTHIIHAAAYTDVAKAETDRKAAYALNVTATKNIAVTKKDRCRLIYISTDAVYPGSGDFNQMHEANPVSYYGLTKYLGELEALSFPLTTVLRTCFYGRSSTGRGLIEWLLRASRASEPIHIFHNHLFSPLHVRTTAQRIIKYLDIPGARVQNLASVYGISKVVFLCHAAKILFLPTDKFIVTSHPNTRDLRMVGSTWNDDLLPVDIFEDMNNLTGPIC